ncbi:hypothetical protein Q9233_000658 [Columba guinea]|nr:hypothetical protein Q9233_000658 [Columba guinea]
MVPIEAKIPSMCVPEQTLSARYRKQWDMKVCMGSMILRSQEKHLNHPLSLSKVNRFNIVVSGLMEAVLASVRNLYQQQARLKYQLWQTVHDVDAFELFPIDEA